MIQKLISETDTPASRAPDIEMVLRLSNHTSNFDRSLPFKSLLLFLTLVTAALVCIPASADVTLIYGALLGGQPIPKDEAAIVAYSFAPRLRFDQKFGTASGEDSKCFPSDPQVYYRERAQGVNPINLCNQNYSTISSNQIPIFYIAKEVNPNIWVIRYWYFYAWQSNCAFGRGSHPADWESLAVKVVNGSLSRVAFFQHRGWYTLDAKEVEMVGGTHPVAYVGKNSHGSYHDDGGTGGCLYFQDFRNPDSKDYRMDTWNNLIPLARGDSMPDWMNCQGDCFDGIEHPIEQTGELLELRGCADTGCEKSQVNNQTLFIDPL